MQKLNFLLSICLLGMVLTSCNSQSVSTPDPALTATPDLEDNTPVPSVSPPLNFGPDVVLYRGNPQRTGVYNVPAIRHQPEVKWQSKVSSKWLVSPMLAEGILYTGSGDGSLYALDAETGEEIWSAGGFGQLESTGAIAGDVIVAGGYGKLVQALDRRNGNLLWTYKTGYAMQGSPLIVDDRVYIATNQAVYALGLQSGQLIWEVATGNEDAFMGAPAYQDGTIYTTGGRLLLALDGETGRELWRVEKEEQFLGLSIANQLVYVGNWDRHLYAFDQSTGEERWKFEANGEIWFAPAVNDDVVYAGNGDQFLYALNAQTGALLWSFKTAGRAVSEPLISDGVVYVSDSNHESSRGPRHLYAFDAATGEELWMFETISTLLPAPALGDGVIYVVSAGDVIALK